MSCVSGICKDHVGHNLQPILIDQNVFGHTNREINTLEWIHVLTILLHRVPVMTVALLLCRLTSALCQTNGILGTDQNNVWTWELAMLSVLRVLGREWCFFYYRGYTVYTLMSTLFLCQPLEHERCCHTFIECHSLYT